MLESVMLESVNPESNESSLPVRSWLNAKVDPEKRFPIHLQRAFGLMFSA